MFTKQLFKKYLFQILNTMIYFGRKLKDKYRGSLKSLLELCKTPFLLNPILIFFEQIFGITVFAKKYLVCSCTFNKFN